MSFVEERLGNKKVKIGVGDVSRMYLASGLMRFGQAVCSAADHCRTISCFMINAAPCLSL